MSFSPKRRYSAVAVFSEDLERVVLIHKLRPNWQAGKANLPGGKVEAEQDYINANVEDWQGTHEEACDEVYRRCARRELREETGYDGGEWTHLTTIHPIISYSTERIELYVARKLVMAEASLEAGEFLEVFTANPVEAMRWVREGLVTDVKTIIGLFWLEKIQRGEWK